MATKKTATKKYPNTSAPKKSTRKVKDAPVPSRLEALRVVRQQLLYIVSERRLLTWTPLFAFPDRESAADYARMMNDASGLSFQKFKVDGVNLLESNDELDAGPVLTVGTFTYDPVS